MPDKWEYLLFVFSLSLVIAASVLKQVIYAGASLMSFKFALLGLIVFLIVAFVLPLFAFTPVLLQLKKQGLSRYGALVSRHHLAFEAKWIDGDGALDGTVEDPLGSPDVSSLADLSASYQIIQEMRPVPVTKQSIVPLVLAALLPFVAVAATQVPFKQVLGAIKGLLLLWVYCVLGIVPLPRTGESRSAAMPWYSPAREVINARHTKTAGAHGNLPASLPPREAGISYTGLRINSSGMTPQVFFQRFSNQKEQTVNLSNKLIAEFIGTFWLVLGGCGSAVLAAAYPNVGIGLLGVALAFGLTVLTMAYAIGHISGCHLNPAVSVGLMVGGRFPAGELIPYIVAQKNGADGNRGTCGSLLVTCGCCRKGDRVGSDPFPRPGDATSCLPRVPWPSGTESDIYYT